MKKLVLVLACACLAAGLAAADRHLKAAEIQRYIDGNPIEPRIPGMMIYISQKSEELNARGYRAYLDKRYDEAIALFKEAIEYDADNSFA